MQAKLQQVKSELRRRKRDPVPDVGEWLKSVVSGHFRYFGVPGNGHALAHFRFTVSNLWYYVLRRRSQKGCVLWERLIRRWLLRPISAISIPSAVCASLVEARAARTDLGGGYGESRIPTATTILPLRSTAKLPIVWTRLRIAPARAPMVMHWLSSPAQVSPAALQAAVPLDPTADSSGPRSYGYALAFLARAGFSCCSAGCRTLRIRRLGTAAAERKGCRSG